MARKTCKGHSRLMGFQKKLLDFCPLTLNSLASSCSVTFCCLGSLPFLYSMTLDLCHSCSLTLPLPFHLSDPWSLSFLFSESASVTLVLCLRFLDTLVKSPVSKNKVQEQESKKKIQKTKLTNKNQREGKA